jgi:hypothetical protein
LTNQKQEWFWFSLLFISRQRMNLDTLECCIMIILSHLNICNVLNLCKYFI